MAMQQKGSRFIQLQYGGGLYHEHTALMPGPPRMPPDLDAVQAFVLVAEQNSFIRAA